MEEYRKANLIYNKNGQGNITNKITIPVTWAKKLGFTENNKNCYIILHNNKIIIKKELKESN